MSAGASPNLASSFEKQEGWRVHQDYGVAIGYHYMGGHPGTPWPAASGVTNTWISPQKASDDPTLVLVRDDLHTGTLRGTRGSGFGAREFRSPNPES